MEKVLTGGFFGPKEDGGDLRQVAVEQQKIISAENIESLIPHVASLKCDVNEVSKAREMLGVLSVCFSGILLTLYENKFEREPVVGPLKLYIYFLNQFP